MKDLMNLVNECYQILDGINIVVNWIILNMN